MNADSPALTPEAKDRFMRHCLALARRGWGTTHPNPMVGAVIVEDGRIVAEGWHARAGEGHAEVMALASLNRGPRPDAVMFVTLEPCSTHGRTPPCVEAIVRCGIRYVVVGATDPNPAHAGRGIELLKAAGVTVETRVLTEECDDLNLIFNHWITRAGPLIAGKVAVTLDGRIATRTGESQWITGTEARADVMRWRRLFPAIAVGAGTAMHDQPRLTSRIEGEDEWSPVRFVFDGILRLAMERQPCSLLRDEFRERTIVVASEQAGTGYVRKLQSEGIRVWVLPGATPGKVSFPAFRARCTQEGITGVYVEGGAHLLSEMLHARELDYLFAYRAPVLFGDDRARPMFRGLRTERLDQAVRLERVRHLALGDDQLVRGTVAYPGRMSVDETVFGHG
jgi:diaminohydroxyphosphoribosylaminopyrimidine deaminase/5-amino-6-(5-phosphoribosylamino)uracil reductase